jgi:starch phosphorylase
MKFALNGALTIGTLDGANIEIREQVGPENFFLFGLTADQVENMKRQGFRPRDYYEACPELKETIDLLSSGYFSPDEPGLFRPLVDSLLDRDDYMLLPDYAPYLQCQEHVSKAYLDQEHWTRMSILNVARIGYFSSDRSIRDYCARIWRVTPVGIDLEVQDAPPRALRPPKRRRGGAQT